jgi:excisionase family DNA binding protein
MVKTPAAAIESPWLTPAQTADYLIVNLRSVHQMMHDGRLPYYSLSRKIARIHIDDIDAALGRPRAGVA